MKALVVTFDRWPLRRLGCYGHPEVETPHLDRFADRAVVFDNHFIESVDAEACNHAWWTGRSQFPPAYGEQERAAAWAPLLHAAGIATHLFSTVDAAAHSRMARFAHMHAVDQSRGPVKSRVTLPFSHLAEDAIKFLKAAAARGDDGWLAWMHAPGLPPAATDGGSDEDGEEIGVAALLDQLLGQLFDALDAHVPGSGLLVVFTAAAGETACNRLENGNLNGMGESAVHVPLIVRASEHEMGTRRRCLTQSIDLAPTLLDWFGIAVPAGRFDGQSLLPILRDEAASLRDHICLGNSQGGRGIRTVDFYLVEPAATETREGEGIGGVTRDAARGPLLFLKPEDFWDIHNVAGQYPEVVNRLQELIHGRPASAD